MELQREKEFVSQYHYDARNLEWEKENGTPETKVEFSIVKSRSRRTSNFYRCNCELYDCL